MTPQEFDNRLLEERGDFLRLCQEEMVFGAVEKIEPRRAPAFAEELLLAFEEYQAKARIRKDREGAAAFAFLLADLVRDRKERKLVAAGMPSRDIPRFYVICRIVLDADKRDRNEFPDLFRPQI